MQSDSIAIPIKKPRISWPNAPRCRSVLGYAPRGLGGEVERRPRGVIAAFDGLIARRRMHLKADGFSGPALDTKNFGSEIHRDAFVAQHLQDCSRDVGIFESSRPASSGPALDDAHPAAEPAIGLRHLQAYIAAAEHDQVGRAVDLARAPRRWSAASRQGPEYPGSWPASRD